MLQGNQMLVRESSLSKCIWANEWRKNDRIEYCYFCNEDWNNGSRQQLWAVKIKKERQIDITCLLIEVCDTTIKDYAKKTKRRQKNFESRL